MASIRIHSISLLFSLCSLLTFSLHAQNFEFRNSNLPIEERVEILFKQMTWQEKLCQTFSFHLSQEMLDKDGNIRFSDEIKTVLPYGIGQLGKPSWVFDKGPKESAELTNKIQQIVIQSNRFGIPVIFHEEALHGLWARGSTVFPQAIAMSCSWDPSLIYQVFKRIAQEVRSRGSHQVNTPMLDVCRDPRWGRIEESYGEDPYLTSRFAVAIVKGLQGSSAFIDKDHVIATVKHFAAYGLTEGGLNKSPAFFGERFLREVVLQPFKAAITEAGALSLMPSYNEIDGIPSHANPWLLKRVLKDEWHFKGFVVSDYGGVVQLNNFHHIASDNKEAGKIALLAGVDMELDNPYCFYDLLKSIEADTTLQHALDQSVKRILEIKFRLGLFDDPFVNPDRAEKINHSKENVELARKVAESSIVLLKNKNHLLPLKKAKFKHIAVIGPHANVVQYGGYSTRHTENGITILDGIKNYLGTEVKVSFAEGCRIHEGSGHWLDGVDNFTLSDSAKNRQKIEQAVEVARKSDLIILAVGSTPVTCGEFIGYRHNLDLFGQQNELVKAILNLKIPTVVCLVNGRPLTINEIAQRADAILETWYSGEQAGLAIAKVLFGEINPSGKLTLTFPQSVGQIPLYYSKKPSAFHDYLAFKNEALYPFGYGLSYTKFQYSNLKINKKKFNVHDEIKISFIVKNVGKYPGDEVTQLYIHDLVSSITRPVKELKRFKKIHLQVGETKRVTFLLSSKDFKFYNNKMEYIAEPGEFEIMIGASSADIRLNDKVVLID